MCCTEVVFLKLYFSHLEQAYLCADYGTKQERDLHLLIQYLSIYMVHCPIQQTW